MADADVDGAHIQTLLLTFLFRYMRELIDAGYVYLAKPPLYLLKEGKQELYFYTEREWDAYRKEIDGQRKLEPQRFKGLGEMDALQLWETTMNPEQRTLLRVTLEDAATADRLFSILMGEDVASRKEWIWHNAADAQHRDVVAGRSGGRWHRNRCSAGGSRTSSSRTRSRPRTWTTRCPSSWGARCPTPATGCSRSIPGPFGLCLC